LIKLDSRHRSHHNKIGGLPLTITPNDTSLRSSAPSLRSSAPSQRSSAPSLRSSAPSLRSSAPSLRSWLRAYGARLRDTSWALCNINSFFYLKDLLSNNSS
jgi:hypothetical protein